MHPNPAYRKTSRARNLAFARAEGFGALTVTAGAAAPMISHIPFLLDEAGQSAEFHLVRSNPIWRALEAPRPARLAVIGPHGYISPDWYGLEDQVPTWNYVAVHLTGTVERLDEAALRPMLDRLSEVFEARLAPKPPWHLDKMDAETLARMMRMIAPCRLRIEQVDGTWKLAQNKPEAARLGAAHGLAAAGLGMEAACLAALMETPQEQETDR